MFATGPPAPAGTAPPSRIVDVRRRRFDSPAALAADAAHHERLGVYVADLLRPYAPVPDRAGPAAGRGQSYGEMAEAVLGAAVPPAEGVELLVLAYAAPDIAPGRATAVYLSHVCPGDPLAFALCDQGVAAAFTGLRLIAGYAATGDCRRAALVVVEQAEPLHGPLTPVAMPAVHAAVALVCDSTPPVPGCDSTPAAAVPGRDSTPAAAVPGSGGAAGGAGLGPVRQHAGVAPERVAVLLAAAVAEAPGATLVLGDGLATIAGEREGEGAAAVRVRRAPPGQPTTGVWWALADELADPTAGGPLLVADYDPHLGYLCVATLHRGRPVAGAPAGAVPAGMVTGG